MKSTPSPRVRLLAVLALILLAGAGVYLLLNGSSTSSSASDTNTTHITPHTTTHTQTTAKHSAKAHKHRASVEGVAALDAALVAHPLVVVSVYAPNVVTDNEAMNEAKAGAAKVGAGFVAFNIYEEKLARQLATLLGDNSQANNPEVLIFKRPRTLAFALQGFADSQVVAQAAQNVFPHVEPWVNDANRICARFLFSLGAVEAKVKNADLATAASRKRVATALEQSATLLNQEAQALSGVRTTVRKAKNYARLVAGLKQVSSNMSSEAKAIRRNDQTTALATEQTDTTLIATMNTLASNLQLATCAS